MNSTHDLTIALLEKEPSIHIVRRSPGGRVVEYSYGKSFVQVRHYGGPWEVAKRNTIRVCSAEDVLETTWNALMKQETTYCGCGRESLDV